MKKFKYLEYKRKETHILIEYKIHNVTKRNVLIHIEPVMTYSKGMQHKGKRNNMVLGLRICLGSV